MSRHLTPELVFGYEQGLLSPAELKSVHQHIQECGECRGRLAQSIDIEGLIVAAQEQPQSRSYLPYAAAAAVVLVALLSGWLWFQSRSKPATVASIELPAFVQELNPPRQTLMGEPRATQGGEMSPRGTAVLDPRPTFRWAPQAGDGWTYKVQVFGPGSDLALESPELATPAWRPDQDLRSAVNYQWQVTATRTNQRLTLPGPPDTPPRFRIVDPATAKNISSLVARGVSHLDLASAFAHAGLVDDARRELDRAIQDHPDDPNLHQLRDRLH